MFFLPSCTPIFTVTGLQSDQLFSLIGDAVTSQSNANVDETKANWIRAWDKWCKFLQSIGIRSNLFLYGFSCWRRQLVLVAFTQAIRQDEFSQVPKKRLVVVTVRDTIGYLYQAFKAYLREMGHCHFCWNRPSEDTKIKIQV